MSQLNISDIPYRAVLTREPFLFYETRATARLMMEGLGDEEITNRVVRENVFQYPTEKSLRRMTRTCLQRLHALDDETLIEAIAAQPQDVAKQICLYAMMKQYRLVHDFMISVIGEHFRQQDLSLSRMDVNVFFLRLQEQDDAVATWSATTIAKLEQVLMRILVENEYLDDVKSDRLNPVLLGNLLENAMRANGDEYMFPAFNYFE